MQGPVGGGDPAERITADAAWLRALLQSAIEVFNDEVRRCKAAYEGDCMDRKPARASAARQRHPEAPWMWYMDDDAANLGLALSALDEDDYRVLFNGAVLPKTSHEEEGDGEQTDAS